MSSIDPNIAYTKWLRLVQLVYFWKARSFKHCHEIGHIESKTAHALKQEIETHFTPVNFAVKSTISTHFAPVFDADIEQSVIDNYIFFNPSRQHKPLTRVVRKICRFAASRLGYPVRVANIRIWTLDQTSSPTAAANAWHKDGMPPGIHKIMCYLTPASLSTGTTEIEIPGSSVFHVDGPEGTILLFDNSDLMHRGLPPTKEGGSRLILEVTVIPGLAGSAKPIFAGSNAQYPKLPWQDDPIGQIFMCGFLAIRRALHACKGSR